MRTQRVVLESVTTIYSPFHETTQASFNWYKRSASFVYFKVGIVYARTARAPQQFYTVSCSHPQEGEEILHL